MKQTSGQGCLNKVQAVEDKTYRVLPAAYPSTSASTTNLFFYADAAMRSASSGKQRPKRSLLSPRRRQLRGGPAYVMLKAWALAEPNCLGSYPASSIYQWA